MKFLILLLFIPVYSFAQSTLDTVSILNGRVKILAPKELSFMTDEMWAVKYKKNTRPTMVLTDENGEVNLIANLTEQPATEKQLTEVKDFQVKQLKVKRPDLNLLGDGIKSINGRTIGYIKFLTQAIDQKVFNYYFFTIIDGKILLFTFNCTEKLQKKWEETADKIVASLKIS